jgi:alkanesulfonate monooxygenase SsuD/methylene tetrahydromethanopterin reductase-like flavin-dependent oxidoreductase (luciferase family)
MNDAFPDTPLEFGMFDWIEDSGLPAADIFEHKMKLVEAADRAGFYAWQIAEHQGTPLSIDGSPAILLASAIQRTKKLRMGALTWCLPWYNPYRFYNEICMLDQMSGGRIELGVGRGISPIESSYMGIKSTDESREVYRETLDIFFAMSRTDKFSFEGKRFSYKDLELHLKPVQRPYPPLWFPSSDRNSIDFTAKHGYHTVLNTSLAETRLLYEQYRETWVKHRNDPGRHNAHVAAPMLGKSQLIVVADTDAEGEKLGLEAYEAWRGHINYLTDQRGLPPLLKRLGATDRDSVTRFAGGSAKTVADQLTEAVRESGINYLLCVFSFGNLRPEAAMRSMELFAKDVMPKVKAAVSPGAARPRA